MLCSSSKRRISLWKNIILIKSLFSALPLFLLIISAPSLSLELEPENYEASFTQAKKLAKTDTDEAVQLARHLVASADTPQLKAKSLNLLGLIEKQRKNYSAAENYHRQAYQLAIHLKDKKRLVNALNGIAETQRLRKQYNEALATLKQSIAAANQYHVVDSLVTAYKIQGNTYKSTKRYKESLTSFLLAIQNIEKTGDIEKNSSLYSNTSQAYAGLGQLDYAILYMDKALQIEQRATSPSYAKIATIQENLSEYNRRRGNYSRAIEHARAALELAKQHQLHKIQQNSLLNLAIIYRKVSDYHLSLEYASELKSLYKAHNDLRGIAIANIQIGSVYERLKQYQIAIEFYQEALDVPVERAGLKHKASASRGMASALYKTGHTEQALIFAENAKTFYLKTNNHSGEESATRLIGNIYLALGDKKRALTAFEQALQLSNELGTNWSKSNNLITIGKVLAKTDSNRAQESIQQGIEIAKSISAKSLIRDGYETLAQIASLQKHFKAAYKYSTISNDISSEINQEILTRTIANQKIIHEIEDKERKISELVSKSYSGELQLASQAYELKLLDSKYESSKLKLSREQTINTTSKFIAAFSLLVFIFLYVKFRHIKRNHYFANQNNQHPNIDSSESPNYRLTIEKLLGAIARHLRNPTSKLASTSETIALQEIQPSNKDRPAKPSETLTIISRRSLDLLDDIELLQSAKNRSTQEAQELSEASLKKELQYTINEAKTKNIDFRFEIDQKTMASIYVISAIKNILQIAIQLTTKNETITTRIKSTDDSVAVYIAHTGKVISNAQLQSLFDNADNLEAFNSTIPNSLSAHFILCHHLSKLCGGDFYLGINEPGGNEFCFIAPTI